MSEGLTMSQLQERNALLVTENESLKAERDALEARVKQLEWDSVFIPKDIEAALAVMGVALPESKEEFNFSINRWVQRLVDRVIRVGPELDAERNNLRAEGALNILSEMLEEISATGKGASRWKLGFIDYAWAVVAEKRATYLNQLRAGEPS